MSSQQSGSKLSPESHRNLASAWFLFLPHTGFWFLYVNATLHEMNVVSCCDTWWYYKQTESQTDGSTPEPAFLGLPSAGSHLHGDIFGNDCSRVHYVAGALGRQIWRPEWKIFVCLGICFGFHVCAEGLQEDQAPSHVISLPHMPFSPTSHSSGGGI